MDTRDENPARGVSRIPIPPTRLIGRRRELDEVSAVLLGVRSRLVTLVGVGGIGKTHLAQEAGRDLAGAFADGAVWVPLAALRDPGLVPAELARALGVADDGARPLEDALADAVAGRALLLVVDNVEQVVAGAPVLARLLAASPASTVLATSRRRLDLPGEHVVEVPPLPAATDGVALFLARADQAGIPIPASRLPAVAEICHRLDGLPLAIELAAAAARHLTVRELLDRLGQSLDLLVDGPRDVDPRQRTMRATIAWSDDLLTPDQRACFRRLGVFAGAPRDLIDRVVSVGPLSGEDVDLALAALVEAHLLRRDDAGPGPRYVLLETVRAYALERLADAGELPSAAAAHVAAFTDLAARAEEGLAGPGSVAWHDRLEREHGNLRSAAAWAVEHGDPADVLRIAAGAVLFFSNRGHRLEWRERIDHALALAGEVDPLLAAAALRASGLLLEDLRDYAAAEHRYAAGLAALPGEPAAARLRCQLLSGLGILAVLQNDYPTARARYGDALRVATAAALPRDVIAAEFHLGRVAMMEGDLDEADRCFTSVLATTDDPHLRLRVFQNIAMLSYDREDYARLRAVVLESLPIARQAGDLTSIAVLLIGLGNASVGLGETGGTAPIEDAVARSVALSDPYLEVGARQSHAAALRHDGDLPAAAATLAVAFERIRQLGVPIASTEVLEELLPVLVGLGRFETAARLVGACDRARADHAYPRFHRRRRIYGTYLAELTAAMPDPALASAIAAGATLSLDAAVDLALSTCQALSLPPA